MSNSIVVTDNFLDEREFTSIQESMMGANLPWFYASNVVSEEDQDYSFQFVHMFACKGEEFSPYLGVLSPLLNKMGILPEDVLRVKANMLGRTSQTEQHTWHVDRREDELEEGREHMTAIFYINTNNGKTLFEGGAGMKSVANRLAVFPNNIVHTGTSCTDEKTRVVVNINYMLNKT